jgi:hypothetical protein
MVADIVRLSSEMTRQFAIRQGPSWAQIKQILRFHLFVSTLLQPWYFFLYFETRSLPEQQRLQSIQIELDAIKYLEQTVSAGVQKGEFYTENPHMVANAMVVMLQDWYLKPWKNNSSPNEQIDASKRILAQEKNIDVYYQQVVGLVQKLLSTTPNQQGLTV